MKKYEYEILARPRPLQRHRTSAGRVYDPQYKDKQETILSLKQQHKGPPLQGRLNVHAIFTFKPPPSWSKKERAAVMGKPHAIRPDLSNLIKYYEDCANGIIWHDDAQIYSLTIRKMYDEIDSTFLVVIPLDEHES